MSESTNRSAEKTLVSYAKFILILGIVLAILAFFYGIYMVAELGSTGAGLGEVFLAMLLMILYAGLVLLPFLMSWAILRVFANISLNIIDLRKDVEEINKQLPKPSKTETDDHVIIENPWVTKGRTE